MTLHMQLTPIIAIHMSTALSIGLQMDLTQLLDREKHAPASHLGALGRARDEQHVLASWVP